MKATITCNQTSIYERHSIDLFYVSVFELDTYRKENGMIR